MRQPTSDVRATRVRERTGSTSPEWETERWKHMVEAEARSRFKKRIQGAGRIRPRGRHQGQRTPAR